MAILTPKRLQKKNAHPTVDLLNSVSNLSSSSYSQNNIAIFYCSIATLSHYQTALAIALFHLTISFSLLTIASPHPVPISSTFLKHPSPLVSSSTPDSPPKHVQKPLNDVSTPHCPLMAFL